METNIYPLHFDSEELKLSKVPYDKDLLSNLRKEHNQDYSFFRNGESIYIASDTEIPLGIGEQAVDGGLYENLELSGSLIRHVFFRSFVRLFGYTPISFYPLRFVSKKDDAIQHLLPRDMQDLFGFRRQIEVQIREILIGDKTAFGAVFNIEYRWFNRVPCSQMFDEGFSLEGLSVVHAVPIPSARAVLAPDEILIGSIKSVRAEDGIIKAELETNEGLIEYDASELFIEKSHANIKEYLTFRLGLAGYERVLDSISRKRYVIRNLKKLKLEIDGLAKIFAKPKFSNKSGFSFSISEKCLMFDSSFKLYDPSYIFDDDDFQKQNNPYFGLQNFGPSDKASFSPKDLRILVVCNGQNRGTFSHFISTLEKGLRTSPGSRGVNYFAGGFAGKFKLHNVSFAMEEIDDYFIDSYLSTLNRFLEAKEKPDLVILEIKREFKSLRAEDNPYFHVKAHLMGLGIPVQFVDSDILKQTREDFAFFNIISLQMYAKLGGIPWVLPKRGSYDKEIVVGVGSHVERTNKFVGNLSRKIVGITTFFTGEGRYLFGNKCKEVEYERYFEELLNSLELSINAVAVEHNWQPDSTILIIFHIFKPIKNIELEVIEKLVTRFTQFKIKFAFLTISDSHPFLLFDSKQAGIYGKGEYLPLKGSTLKLSDRSCLLQARSAADIKTTKHGVPKPLLLRIISSDNAELNFKDLNHLTQQVLNFSNLSFSSFQSSRNPVTIFYSDKIAMWLTNLKKIAGWKSLVVNTDLKRKKWFL